MFDEGNSMDLSPIKLSSNHFTEVFNATQKKEVVSMADQWNPEEVDDTFSFKKAVLATT